jgi:hypothetical protein
MFLAFKIVVAKAFWWLWTEIREHQREFCPHPLYALNVIATEVPDALKQPDMPIGVLNKQANDQYNVAREEGPYIDAPLREWGLPGGKLHPRVCPKFPTFM